MRLTALFILTFVFSVDSYSCECNDWLEVKEEFERSDIVVSGQVIEILDLGENFFEGLSIKRAGYRVKLEVLTTFKGKSESKFLVVHGSGDNCDFFFRKGMKYLVYGWTNEGELITSSCTRTAELGNNPDINELKKIKTVPNNR